MQTITIDRSEYNRLCALQRQLDYWKQRYFAEKERMLRAQSELQFIQRLISNPTLPGKVSSVLYALWIEEQKAAKKPDRQLHDGGATLTRVYREDIATTAGTSIQTVSDVLKKVAESEIIQKKIIVNCDSGIIRKDLYINTLSLVDTPDSISLVTGYGGKREKKPVVVVQSDLPEACPACSTPDNLEPSVKALCHTCGVVHSLPFSVTIKERPLVAPIGGNHYATTNNRPGYTFAEKRKIFLSSSANVLDRPGPENYDLS